MKFLFLMLIFLLSMAFATVDAVAQLDTGVSSALVSIAPSRIVSPRVGEQFTVSVKITGGKNVTGYQFSLQYDSTALDYVTGLNADYLIQAFAAPPIVKANQVTLAATSLGELSQGDGTLATVTFGVLAVKASALTLTKVNLITEQGKALPVRIENGEVTADPVDPIDVPDRVTVEPTTGPYISINNIVEPRGGDFSGEVPLTFTVWSKANTRMRNQRIRLTADSNIDVSFSKDTIQTTNTANATAKATLLLQESSTGTETVVIRARVQGSVNNVNGTLSFTVRQTPSSFSVGSFARQIAVGAALQISATVKSKNGTVMSNALVRFIEASTLIAFGATSIRTDANGKATSTLRTVSAGTAQFAVDVSGLPRQTFNITVTPQTAPADIPDRVTIQPTTGPYISSTNVVEPKGGDFSGEVPLTVTVWSKANTRMRGQTLQLTADSDIDVSFSADTLQTTNTTSGTAKTTLRLQESSTGTETIVVTATVAEADDVNGTLSLTVRQTPSSFSVSPFTREVTSGAALEIFAIVRSKNGTVMPNALVRFTKSSTLIAFDATSVRTDAAGKATNTLRAGPEGSTQFTVSVPGLPQQRFNITITPQTIPENIPDRVEIEPTTGDYISIDNVVEPKGGNFSGEIPLTVTVWSEANTKMRSQTVHLTADSDIDVSFSKDTVQTANAAGATAETTLLLQERSTGIETVVVTAKVDEFPDVTGTLSLTVRQTPGSFSVNPFTEQIVSGATRQISAIVKSKNGTVMPNARVEFAELSNLIAFNTASLRTDAAGKATSTLRTGSVGSARFTISTPELAEQSFDVTITSPITHGSQSQELSSRQGTRKNWFTWELDHYTLKQRFYFLGDIVETPTVEWAVTVKGHGRLEFESFQYAGNWVEVKIRAKEHREKPTKINVSVHATFQKRAPMPGAPLAQPFIPEVTTVLPNYPNPFNPETWIPYQLAEPAEVTLTIYSVRGALIRTLALGHQPAGFYRDKSRAAYWDGRNNVGERVASGVYFYTLTAGEFAKTGKMLITK